MAIDGTALGEGRSPSDAYWTNEPMNCPSCGAWVKTTDLRCANCGSAIRQLSSISPKRANASKLPAQGKELEELLRYTPSAVGTGVGLVIVTIVGLAFTSFAVFFIVMSKRGGAPLIFRLFPMIFVLAGLVMVGAGIRGLVKLASSPLERLPAVVVGKRHEYSSSSRGSGSTSYYLTIETEDGKRKEHSVRGRLYGEVEKGDVGVAYLRGGFLLDFKRVRVPKA